jgi:hypothetical protein
MSPNKSNAKQKYFEYLESKGKLPKMRDQEFDDATEKASGYSFGGEVEDEDDNFDYDMGHAEEFDSSGEPHTEDELEDRHPMEFMSRGGMVKKMSRGGRAHNSSFAKALSRYR